MAVLEALQLPCALTAFQEPSQHQREPLHAPHVLLDSTAMHTLGLLYAPFAMLDPTLQFHHKLATSVQLESSVGLLEDHRD